MDQSHRNAKILATIGFIQVAPLTYITVMEFPIHWLVGMSLLVFYIQHARGEIQNIKRIRLMWGLSTIFNLGGYFIPLFALFAIGELITGYNNWEQVLLLVPWSASICANVWLSLDAIIYLNKDRRKGEKAKVLQAMPANVLNAKDLID